METAGAAATRTGTAAAQTEVELLETDWETKPLEHEANPPRAGSRVPWRKPDGGDTVIKLLVDGALHASHRL
jgi:hypothetical protein